MCWRGLLECQEVIKRLSMWRLGDGKIFVYGMTNDLPLTWTSLNFGIGGLSMFVTLMTQKHCSGKISRLPQIFPPSIVCQILQVPSSKSGISDKIIWPWTKCEIFSVKSCYRDLMTSKHKTIQKVVHHLQIQLLSGIKYGL